LRPVTHATASARRPTQNLQLRKIQSQLDQQGKAIAENCSQLESTRGDLNNTRTELTGSIARIHDELVLLQKKGAKLLPNLTSLNRKNSRTKAHRVCGFAKLTLSTNTPTWI
jgi:septal ring factor EnvC (AmiA/AmiB activator)